MKKMILGIFAVMAIFASVASAQYTGPSSTVTTVKQALDMPDDTYVTLTGKIEKHLGGDKYQFNDGTGIIIIEIDSKHWMGLTVAPTDTVTITGEIERDFRKRTVDVDSIVKVKK